MSVESFDRKQCFRYRRYVIVVCSISVLISAAELRADDAEVFFETRIRPILVGRCSECHGENEPSSGLRIDSRENLLKGGDRGPAIKPGDAEASLLIRAIHRDGDLEMPPEEKLPAREIRALTQWVKIGAPWPKNSPPIRTASSADRRDHWAFQPVKQSDVPAVNDASWIRTPIDRFVLNRLKRAGLSPSPEADRRTLIRRVSYTLTGLPPTPEEVAEFVNDPDPKAYERLVDRLLASPHYGEQWARHWLDVARYSDTKGYVYAREERFWTHAWCYRDWVVDALNSDMPYDRFLQLQLAADQVPDRTEDDLAAMGFLTIGRRFLGVKHDIIDDRIDVVTRGMLGLTVGCARCHDHKYDPIPTADYYSLYGVFDSSAERLVALDQPSHDDEAFWKELKTRREKLESTLATRRAESSQRVRERVQDYLHAQTELEKYPAAGFDQVFEKSDILPSFVRRWEHYLREAKRRGDPLFVPWHAYAEIPPEQFTAKSVEVTARIQEYPTDKVNRLVAEAFTTPPESFADVIERYGKLFQEVDSRWTKAKEEAAKSSADAPTKLTDPAAEQIRLVLYGSGAPCEVPDQPIVHTERYFDSGSCTELWKLQGELDRWIIQSKQSKRFAVTLIDRPEPTRPRIFRRGNPLNQGEEVPRGFVSVLSGVRSQPFQNGSGRSELAEAIIDPNNPLTARVIVNRVWAHHFGSGLVKTPSDFGLRAGEPSHPELLDYLATRFVQEGWKLKSLHRWILFSATYRQSSKEPVDSAMFARAVNADPENRLLWRMNPRRLTFEEFRDSLLAASNELDRTLGGKPAKLFEQPYPKRRTLYGLVDRQYLPGTLRMFDFANPDLHIPERSETTVPQQALFFLNHPLMLERTRALVESSQRNAPKETIAAMFQNVLQRNPTEGELSDALQFIEAASQTEGPPVRKTADDWSYGYGSIDEKTQRVSAFTPLPHFTGTAWQGGENWPDSKLGWVQLTAEGGHPGNDRAHAAIRRWTAPRAMTIEIRTKLIHQPEPGDGIRAFIVSNRTGVLNSTSIHQQTVELNVDPISVEAGETIDFCVDIGEVLNSDQYLWSVDIREFVEGDPDVKWNSRLDFPRDAQTRLTAWEQLAQVLFCTNEFLFVD